MTGNASRLRKLKDGVGDATAAEVEALATVTFFNISALSAFKLCSSYLNRDLEATTARVLAARRRRSRRHNNLSYCLGGD